ncbi:Hypothetical predicted protein [Marmota monax]|uniref:Ig-like domain-containing protein n=1 Tax=Marmota monax TaxID=9995 RepID=A0A5E4D9B7_MARMO|nr:hypothetical protein GHT09_011809 [Marmota monax]VTJ90350.1 Hypothetical predicted protein [Marmota monax]
MVWTHLLLTLLTLCSESQVHSELIQESSMSASKGEKVTLSCTGNSNNVGTYYVGWYQQILGSSPKTVMLETTRPSGIPDHFSGSHSGNTATLTITGLQVEDEANYYCEAWDKSLSAHTVLQMHGELRQKPALALMRG